MLWLVKRGVLFVMLCMACVANVKHSHNLCDTLKRPNSLLLDRFIKIQIKRLCRNNANNLQAPIKSGSGKACFYRIPASWATSIEYPKLQYTGMMLRTRNRNAPCPDMTYSLFENVTFKNHCKSNNCLWKTKQTNPVRRFLRTKKGDAPKGSPKVIRVGGIYHTIYLRFKNIFVPLATKVVHKKK